MGNKKVITKLGTLVEEHNELYQLFETDNQELSDKIDLMRKDLMLHLEIATLSDEYTKDQKKIILETIEINEEFITIVKKAFVR